MSSRGGSRVRRSRTVDSAGDHNSSHGSIHRDEHVSSPTLLPITQGQRESSVPSVSSIAPVASTWGRGTGRRGPTRCATERRLEPGQRLHVTVVGGSGVGIHGADFVTRIGTVIRMHCKIWEKNLTKLPEEKKIAIFRDIEATFEWDRTPQTDKEMLQHMTSMLKGWRGVLKSRHYMGKTFEDAIASVPAGVDPLEWRSMCEKWNTKEEQDISERNSQNRSHQTMTYRRGRTSIYQLKDDFVKTHQREPDRIEIFKLGRCKELPDGTERWVDDESNNHYERMTQMMIGDLESDAHTPPVTAEEAFIAVMGRDRPGRVRCAGRAETLGSWYGKGEGTSFGSYQSQVLQLQQELQNQNKRMEEMAAERSRDRQEIEAMREQMTHFMQQFSTQAARAPPSSTE